ncbi:helix-turn-helix domain-containing protein [Paenibacillus jiagnxiensis]|uniref:helix-turn-helix domain-containing protein n=1 Tax=Paenibacillus jiagnxiensis TaxID=3228926 RepID=UPI0033B41114
MEKENAQTFISDTEFNELLHLAKEGSKEAMFNILSIFEQDILRVSKYIRMSREDVIQCILTDFIELLKNEDI